MALLTVLSGAETPRRSLLADVGSVADGILGLPAGSCGVAWKQWRTGPEDRSAEVVCLLAVDETEGFPDEERQALLHRRLAEVWEGQVRLAVERREFEPSLVVSRPVARVVGGRAEVADDDWAEVSSVIRLDAGRFPEEALAGIAAFSHLEVVFHFDRVRVEKTERSARHPRGNPEWPLVGIFAQRGKNRPNRIGVSRCRLVEVAGHDLLVAGLDAVDGTPVLDIKPYMAEYGPRGAIRQPEWATELMRDYY